MYAEKVVGQIQHMPPAKRPHYVLFETDFVWNSSEIKVFPKNLGNIHIQQ